MERQQKPWSEMTEEEREVTRKSWEHTLPDEFDVFCIGNLALTQKLTIPGNLYVSGHITADYTDTDEINVSVSDSLFVGGNISCDDINVGDCFTVGGDINCYNVNVANHFITDGNVNFSININVGGSFIVDGDVNAWAITTHGDFIVHHVDSVSIHVDNLLDSYDVNTLDTLITAPDFVCRSYEEIN